MVELFKTILISILLFKVLNANFVENTKLAEFQSNLISTIIVGEMIKANHCCILPIFSFWPIYFEKNSLHYLLSPFDQFISKKK